MEKYDVIICGSGPAGLTAALYTSRANLKVLVIESYMPGGKLAKIAKIENYPGIEDVDGADLANKLFSHGLSFGAEYETGEIVSIKDNALTLSDGRTFEAGAFIVATGTIEKTLDLPRAKEFIGKGISYCATCDGNFFKDKDVVVIGDNNTALEEALYLSGLVSKIYIVARRNELIGDQNNIDKVINNPKIEVLANVVPKELIIENYELKGLIIKDINNKERNINCAGIFPYIGNLPATSFLPKDVLNDQGFIKAGCDMSTKIANIFGAGDVIEKDLRQVVTACSDGAIAAASVVKYLKKKED